MARNYDDQGSIRRYLLNELSDKAQQEIEQGLLTDDELFDQLQAVEDELIDQYVGGTLSKRELEMFEKHFLVTPERHEKLRFAKAFRRYVSTHPSEQPKKNFDQARSSWGLAKLFSASPLQAAAFAALILVVGLGGWRIFFYQSDVDKALIALNAAYRDQRPVEARITRLNYAPFVTTRGQRPANVNEAERERAKSMLLNARNEKPTPAVRHALGRVYLAENDFDRAIQQFEEALKADPNGAEIHADLGAAWLEKGKVDSDKAKADPAGPLPGKSLEEFGRSLEYLSKALELDPNSLEALFNRALCREYLKQLLQAEEDWLEYLKKDPSSSWATEARRKLELLEAQKKNSSLTKEKLLLDFIAAYKVRNDEAAWDAISHSRARAGNSIIEALLDDFLTLSISGPTTDADEKLRMISYAGGVEKEKVGDRFTLDLASSYATASSNDRQSLTDARAKMKLGNEYFRKSEFEKAADVYSQAKELFEQKHNTPGALFAKSWIGYAYLRMPKVGESIEIFEPLSREFDERGYRSLLSQSLHALSDATSSRNEFSKTLEYANRGLKTSQEIGDSATAIRCLGQNVSMQLILGDYTQSLTSFNRAVDLAVTIPPEPTLTWPLYHEAALDFYFLGLPAAALSFEQEALRLADISKVPLLRSRSWERLGVIYSRQQNYQQAIESGEKALAEAQNVSGRSRKNILARSRLILGQLHREAGDFRKAIEYFDQSQAIYKDIDFDVYSFQSHKGKLLALIALGEDGLADTELTTVLRLFEDQRKKIVEQSHRDRFFDAGQDTYDVAIGFANTRRKDANQAFEYAEASRARSLYELITTGASIANDHEDLDVKLGSGSTPLTLAAIQTSLPEQTQLIEYAVLDDKVLIWVVTRTKINPGESAISATDLEQKVRSYAATLSLPRQNNRDAVVQAGKELHAKLIAPIEKYLDPDLILCVIPDKSLNYLPFEALMSESSGRYLIQDYKVQRAPSATIFIESSKQAKARERVSNEKLLSVGNPKFDSAMFSLPDLPGAAREAKQIAAFYPPARPLIAEAATAAQVKRGLMEADVVHLATHAVADERSPLRSKLLLTPDSRAGDPATEMDGVLQASEIYQLLRPRARLVVLSACQTGIERSYRGEGAIGLARPFIAAGVPLVVASLWPVDSDETAELMISFHRFRKLQNLPTVGALRQAQLTMIDKQQTEAEKNYAWAAFTVIGGYADF